MDAAAASFAALTHKLDYLDPADIKRVREAYKFADEAHLGQFRASGEPYITHPIAVAGLCADWKLDAQAIMAALMHDVMEDTGATKVELIEKFGAPTAELVDGLTKLDKLQFSTREESQAESFRKMLLAMARDVRVVLIKLADRLHNMRTMDAMPPAKRSRIARETLDIYAPIAHRLGLNQVYRELQELCFQYQLPWRFAALSKAVQKARGHRRDIVDRIQQDVERAFREANLQVQIHGREKTLYSIYTKMREKHLSFAQVNDIFGFRIVVSTLQECYLALGVLHQLYKPMPGRFKDYIAIPKANGYQSLHTTLVSPLGTAVEFQIRTDAMHLVAEKGIAAHWLYKAAGSGNVTEAQRAGAVSLQSLLDIQDETRDAAEFLEHVKVDLFPDAVYVFTPKSKILALPRGATPVDFAYAIHSDIGDHTVAAKVNGEQVALRTELRSGDVVEIITAPVSRPNPAWLNFVRTGRARSKIRHYLKNMKQEESLELGEKLLHQAMRAEGLHLPGGDEASGDPHDVSLWQNLIRWSGNRTRRELLIDIGMGKKIATIVAKRLAKLMAEAGAKPDALTLSMNRYLSDDSTPSQAMVTIDGSEGATVQMATCCRPIPGDGIVGYLGRGEGLVVHTGECQVGKRLFQRDSERWIAVEWAEELQRPFETAVSVLVQNGKGVLAKVAQAVSEAEADITHIDMGHDPGHATMELKLLLSVHDRVHLADVLRTLKRAPLVLRAQRIKPQ
ncbi:RelA/SpoT family protein [Caldimonas thermodepolymerans]|jgi:(p)ppGpp synthetase, RelA/SpoT family|nr:bifunctional (p)ppGpp synthetase/guanosine-3',5'-bis(diphosphate) 3'-pyrophosphohydrolase [Caldimonas thermodepolymerans]RDH94953.1 GTP pyrophosphokinase/guanosine-3',5'-bis(diphosphate) 3'-pyrophosphohydrolase [Caldimonas thermodepolymerans]TCP08916.1 GTP pyrophosphokinase/guanosine-3',5'-bis(diphosphate) 3'-pyrophosphohydrolase [Caldimonas thermodepolymerans]UZG43558.1 bifunctional (p)ppGpp synthetase/guanosine-3',5'-bis(diphosphate) 3'-pyrophosphohydrolase [Caldimonas thermodepolymerans]U